MASKVNLNGYFERIGFSGSIAPTAKTLELLHALHPASIPFENLSPLMGEPVSLELGAIERKLIGEGRGGYCLEHNLLLKAVLEELDFTVRTLAARVLWNHPEGGEAKPTHMVLAVEIGGTTYLADPGFGGLALTAPLKLRADVEQTTPHETFRLSGGDPVWTLEAKLGEEWRALYAFEITETATEAFTPINDYLSGDASSPFTSELRVALSPSGKRLALKNNRFTVHFEDGESEVRLLETVEDIKTVLEQDFGLTLPSADQLDLALERILPVSPGDA